MDRRHVLSHARVGRHDDLVRVPARSRNHRARLSVRATWNIYPFHFSDGDNWSVDDTLLCVDIAEEAPALPASNVFCYGQVDSPYGSGQFIKDLREHFSGDEQLITSEINDRDAIVESIREFLGKGKVTRGPVRTENRPPQLPARRAEPHRRVRSQRRASTSSRPCSRFLSYDQMNEVAAYGGFPTRYPHWRWGMGVRAPQQEPRVRAFQNLRARHQQQPGDCVPPRGQQHGRPEVGDGARVRATSTSSSTTSAFRMTSQGPRRTKTRRRRAEVDRHDGQQRLDRSKMGEPRRHRKGRALHRCLFESRKPHRPPEAFSSSSDFSHR